MDSTNIVWMLEENIMPSDYAINQKDEEHLAQCTPFLSIFKDLASPDFVYPFCLSLLFDLEC